jgi:phage protein D
MPLVPWSRALYTVSFGGGVVNDRIAPFLQSIECVDKAGEVSDTCRITLDDAGGRFAMPEKGTPMVVSLGSLGRGVVERFNGTVDTVRSRGDRGGGMTLEITGKGMDTTSNVKQPNQKHADDKSLGDVASEFGKAGGLSGITVHADLASITRPYWAMDDESVIAWGRRVASEVGGTFKIIGTQGVIVPRSAGISASGKPLTPILVTRGENLISWDVAPAIARPEYQRVRARYYDPAQAKWLEKELEVPGAASGGTTARQSLSMTRADEGEAEKAAGAEGKDAEREKGGGRVDIDGEPTALAEAPVTLSGIREGIDGEYTVETVTDKLTRGSGYVTTLDIVRPQAGGQ